MKIEEYFKIANFGGNIEFSKFSDEGMKGLVYKLREENILIDRLSTAKKIIKTDCAKEGEFEELKPNKYTLNSNYLEIVLEINYPGSNGADISVNLNYNYEYNRCSVAAKIIEDSERIIRIYFKKD